MTAAFAYSDDPNAKFPPHCMSAMIAWGEMAKTIISTDQVGRGECHVDGSVKITFNAFEATFNPDGTFSGRRLGRLDTSPQPPKAVPDETPTETRAP